nr:MAG TPA: hypothetical protein [Caudoviricetes sp.]
MPPYVFGGRQSTQKVVYLNSPIRGLIALSTSCEARRAYRRVFLFYPGVKKIKNTPPS